MKLFGEKKKTSRGFLRRKIIGIEKKIPLSKHKSVIKTDVHVLCLFLTNFKYTMLVIMNAGTFVMSLTQHILWTNPKRNRFQLGFSHWQKNSKPCNRNKPQSNLQTSRLKRVTDDYLSTRQSINGQLSGV